MSSKIRALIITPTLTEEREIDGLDELLEFFERLKRRFKWFLVHFYFNKKYDLVILAA
jgi:hypothetical protein